MSRTATQFMDWQQRATGFHVGDVVVPYFDGAGHQYYGRVVAVWPAIGMIDIEYPHGSKRYPVEDVQLIERAQDSNVAIMPQSPSVPGGVGTVPVSAGPAAMKQAAVKHALYWAERDRKYRPTRTEADSGRLRCPRCKGRGQDCADEPHTLVKAPLRREEGHTHRILVCPHCTFVIDEADVMRREAGAISVKTIKSKSGDSYKFQISGGPLGGLKGETLTYLHGIDPLKRQTASDIVPEGKINRTDGKGKGVTHSVQRKIVDAVFVAMKAIGKEASVNDRQLRNQLIRLAHSNPEIKADLLPLLKEAAVSAKVVSWNGKAVPKHEPGAGNYLVDIGGHGVVKVTVNDNGSISTGKADKALVKAVKPLGLTALGIDALATKTVKKLNPSRGKKASYGEQVTHQPMFASEQKLRVQLIRLAHSNPEFKADILPLLGKSAAVPQDLLEDEDRRARVRARIRVRRRTKMARVMRNLLKHNLKHPSVDLKVKAVGKGLAYQVTVPFPEQLDSLPTQHHPVDFVRIILKFHNIDNPMTTGFMIQDRAAGDGVTLFEWESYLDKKWKHLWDKPLSQGQMDKMDLGIGLGRKLSNP